MKVWPKNQGKFHENKPLVSGIARNRSHLVVEYTSKTGGHRDLVIADLDQCRIWHVCKAVQSNRPCWHLAAAVEAAGWGFPWDVDVIPDFFPDTLSGLRDITDRQLGRPGDFQLVALGGPEPEPKETPPELPPAELPPDDAWLAEYKLPPRVLEKVLRFREVQKARLAPEQAARVPRPRYVASGRELVAAVASLVYGENGVQWEAPLLIGPKGSGKSTLAETLAAVLHLPLSKLFGGVDVNAEYLLGSKTLVPSEQGLDLVTEAKLRAAAKQAGVEIGDVLQRLRGAQLRVAFEPGLLLQAVQAGEMVVVDEINMLVPEVTSLLHGLLDWQKCLSVPGLGTMKAHPSFRLVACMNYGYAGTKELNEAFQDRFRSVQVPHLPDGSLADLLVRDTGCSADTAQQLAGLFHKLAARVENGDLSERVLSVRALIRAVREYHDGVGPLKSAAQSVLTEGLGDRYEADQIKDVIDALVKGVS